MENTIKPELIDNSVPQTTEKDISGLDPAKLSEAIQKRDTNFIINNGEKIPDGSLPEDLVPKMIEDLPQWTLLNSNKFNNLTPQKTAEMILASGKGSFAVFSIENEMQKRVSALTYAEGQISNMKLQGAKVEDTDNYKKLKKLESDLEAQISNFSSVINSIDKKKLMELAINTPNLLDPQKMAFFTKEGEGHRSVISVDQLLTQLVNAKTYDAVHISALLSGAKEGSLSAELAPALKEKGYPELAEQYAKKFEGGQNL